MHNAQIDLIRKGGIEYPVKSSYADVGGAVTDQVIITAVPGKRITIISLVMLCGSTATSVRFRSKPASGTTDNVSMLFQNAANGGCVLNDNIHGWLSTRPGEALAVTTSGGANVGLQYNYIEE